MIHPHNHHHGTALVLGTRENKQDQMGIQQDRVRNLMST